MQSKRSPYTFNLFLNLVVILSLLLPNASALSASAGWRAQDAGEIPTPTLTQLVEETVEPTVTPTAVGTPTTLGTSTVPVTPTLELSSTPSLAPSETLPGATATQPATAAATTTATVLATASAAASPTLSPTAMAEFGLHLDTAPSEVIPGGKLQLRWEIGGIEEETSGELLLELPPGIALAKDEPGSYDEKSGILSLPTAPASGVLSLEASAEDTGGLYPIRAEYRLADGRRLVAQIELPEHGRSEISAAGGTGEGVYGRVKVTFPEDALDSDVVLRIHPLAEARLPAGSPSGSPFEIIALEKLDKEELHQFTREFVIEVGYAKTAHGEAWLVTYDESSGLWKPLPTTYDPGTQTLRAVSDHLSIFDISVDDWSSSVQPRLDAGIAAGQTGGAVYSYPLWTPPGPGGLQPSLALSYSSEVVDGSVVGRNQGAWVGYGWALNVGYIERNFRGTIFADGDDTFSLVANHMAGRVLQANDGSNHLEDENFAQISWNQANDTWTIKDGAGTTYIYGSDLAGEPVGAAKAMFPDFPGGSQEDCPNDYGNWPWRYMLTEVIDKYGNRLEYYYHPADTKLVEHTCDGDDPHTLEMAIHPREIRYAANGGRYRIFFDLQAANRTDLPANWTSDLDYRMWELKRLDKIRIVHDPDGATGPEAGVAVRTYTLAYNDDIFPNHTWYYGGKNKTLTSVTESGLNNASLPTTSFEYDELHLLRVNNGFGGHVAFDYEDQPWYENQAGEANKDTFGECADENEWESGIDCEVVNPVTGAKKLVFDGTAVIRFDNKGQPGGVYKLFVELSTTGSDAVNIRYGSDGGVSQSAATSRFINIDYIVPQGASGNDLLVTVSGDGIINSAHLKYVTWRDRLAAKTIQDDRTAPGGHTTLYEYDDPTTNYREVDCATSLVLYGAQECQDYSGNAMLRTISPANPAGERLATTTWYARRGDLAGKPLASMTSAYEFGEQFQTLNLVHWSLGGAVAASLERVDGDTALRVSNADTSWADYVARSGNNIANKEAAAFSFRYKNQDPTNKIDAVYSIATGSWGASDYRRMGLKVTHEQGVNKVYRIYTVGSVNTLTLLPNLTLLEDTWYNAILLIDHSHMFLQIWQRDDPGSGVTTHEWDIAENEIGPERTWRFSHQLSGYGTTWLDDYTEGRLFSFSWKRYEIRDNTPALWSTWASYADLGIDWVYQTQQTTQRFESSSRWTGERQSYHYDDDYQGGTQYGNLTYQVSSYWDGSVFRDERMQVWRYFPNISSNYLVHYPTWTNNYWCDTAWLDGACYTNLKNLGLPRGNLLTSTIYRYDYDIAQLGGTPLPKLDYGWLTAERRLIRYPGLSGYGHRFQDTQYHYDAWGNTDQVIVSSEEGDWWTYGAGQRVTEYCYGQYTSTSCSADGYHTYLGWEKNAKAQFTRTQVDYNFGQPAWLQDANGAVSQAWYDDLGRLERVARPGDDYNNPTLEASYTYGSDLYGEELRQRVSGSLYRTLTNYYNGLGQLLQREASDANVNNAVRDILVDYGYDALGQQVAVSVPYDVAPGSGYRIPAAQPETQTSYDILGRVVQVQAPDLTYPQRTSYLHLETHTLDANGNLTRYLQDERGRAMGVISPDGPELNYLYDDAGTVITTTYGTAVTEVFSDYLGRKTKMNDADMGTWYYTYNALGGLVRQTDAMGQRVCMYYDELNRLTGKHYRMDDACPSSPTLEVSYKYDDYTGLASYTGPTTNALGRRTGMIDGSGQTMWSYDERGRQIREQKGITGSGTFVTQWLYDSADEVSGMTYPGGNAGQAGEVLSYAYHPQGVLKTAYSNTNNTYYLQNAAYDAAGRMELLNLGAADLVSNPLLKRDYQYYPWNSQGGRLQALQAWKVTPQTYLQELSYTYDPVGNIQTILDARNSSQRQCFAYDALNRLAQASTYDISTLGCASQLGQGNYDEDYSYDTGSGNLSSKTGVGSYTYDAVHKHAVASTSNGWSFQYNANGNMSQRVMGGQTYVLAYDAENHLSTVHKNGSLLVSYKHDGDGNKVQAIYEGTPNDTLVAFIGSAYEYESTGTTTTTRSYYMAGTLRLALRTNTSLSWLFSDHLGSTAVVADASGNRSSEQWYKAWGEVRASYATLPTRRQYTGQYHEASLGGSEGLYDYVARHYDPALGRFTSPDSLIPSQQGVIAWDRYAGMNNNPVRWNDPSGHDACTGMAGTNEPDCGVDGWWGTPLEIYTEEEIRYYREEAAEYVKTGLSIASEPVDWYLSGKSCLSGSCSPWLLLGFLPFIPSSIGGKIDDVLPVIPFEVGLFDDLFQRSTPFDNLHLHHAPQEQVAKQLIPDYDPKKAPTIALPSGIHMGMNITNIKGPYTGTTKEMFDLTLDALSTLTDASPSALSQLQTLWRTLWPNLYP